jgi:hypothetical protein
MRSKPDVAQRRCTDQTYLILSTPKLTILLHYLNGKKCLS